VATVCGFFGPNNVRLTEQAVRTAVAAAAQAEFALWHLPTGVPRQENDVAQFGHLVRYWLAAIRDLQPDTLAFLQARAVAPTTNYGQLPTSNAAATVNAEVLRVQRLLLAGAPGGGVPANLPALVSTALRHARESHRDRGDFSAWSAVWVTAAVRGVGIRLGLEAMVQTRHVGKDELLRASIAHREYAVEAFRRRIGPNRKTGTYHAFEPRAEPIAEGDIIVQERRATPGNGVLTFAQTANLDAIRPPTHSDVVVEVTPAGAVTIGGNLGGPQNSPFREGVRRRRYPVDATQRLVINAATLFEQEDDTGAVVPSQPWVPPPARNPDPRSTARIFTVLRLVETCGAVPGQPFHGGVLT
jgi:hypothetical protein